MPKPKRGLNDALTPEEIDNLNNQKDSAKKEESTPEPEAKDEGMVTLSKESLAELLKASQSDAIEKAEAAAKELADAKAKLEEATKQAEEAKTQAQEKDETLDKQKEDLDYVQNLFKQFGYPNPTDGKKSNVYIAANPQAMDAASAGKEMARLLNSAPKFKYYDRAGNPHQVGDYRDAYEFWDKHLDQTRAYFDGELKKRGYLREGNLDAATTRSDLPEGFLTYLSYRMRETHSPQFIFHQFADWIEDIGKSHGDTIVVPRFKYGDTGAAKSDWELTPGTPLTDQRQPVSEGSVGVTLHEYGLGKNSGNRPISIPEFWFAHSALELESVVQRNLGQNYYQFEEVSVRALWEASTKIRYNNRGAVVTTAGAVQASSGSLDSGICTYRFLVNLYSDMANAQIIPLPDGCYGLILPSIPLAQLKLSLNPTFNALSFPEMSELAAIFNTRNRPMAKKVRGYEGKFANFHIFSTNNYGVGAAGQPGVQTETINSVAQPTRTGFGFGANTICKATGIPMEVRQILSLDGRSYDWYWKEHCEFAQLDVDNAIDSEQQTRVYKLRFTDSPV